MNHLHERNLMNADGNLETPLEVAAQMQRDGVVQILIDRWLQGIELRASI